MKKKFKIVIMTNSAWNLLNFRSSLIKAMVNEGYEVVAVAPHDRYADRVSALGCRFVSLHLDSKGISPLRDLGLLWRLRRFLRVERPNAFLSFTIKPNIYGSIAARSLCIPAINNIAGLGSTFGKQGLINLMVRLLYWIALARSKKVFFQNTDDQVLFVNSGLIDPAVSDKLPGSGVQLQHFRPCPLPGEGDVSFLLVARMLWDKGVREYVEAAKILKERGVPAKFALLGFLDVENPSAIPRMQVDLWVKEGLVEYLGVSDDVRTQIANADCVVLPSYYREGTPRSLLEAAAMARPIVTTNFVGCREVITDGITGYLCQPRNASDLAEKLAKVVAMSPEDRRVMGLRGRRKIEEEFDEQFVIKKYIAAVKDIILST